MLDVQHQAPPILAKGLITPAEAETLFGMYAWLAVDVLIRSMDLISHILQILRRDERLSIPSRPRAVRCQANVLAEPILVHSQ